MGQWCWEVIAILLISQGGHAAVGCSCTGAKLELELRLLGTTSTVRAFDWRLEVKEQRFL